jgi:hypothetical protein
VLGGPSFGVSSGPSPGEQLVETVGGVASDETGEDVGQIGLRLDTVEIAKVIPELLRQMIRQCDANQRGLR